MRASIASNSFSAAFGDPGLRRFFSRGTPSSMNRSALSS